MTPRTITLLARCWKGLRHFGFFSGDGLDNFNSLPTPWDKKCRVCEDETCRGVRYFIVEVNLLPGILPWKEDLIIQPENALDFLRESLGVRS